MPWVWLWHGRWLGVAWRIGFVRRVRASISHGCGGQICVRFAALVSVLVDVCSIRDLQYMLVNALS